MAEARRAPLAGRIAARAMNIVYPSVCPVCGGASDSVSLAPLCRSCFSTITRYEGPACPVCALPVESAEAGLCGDCLRERPPFARVLAYGIYSGALRAAINHLKFAPLKRLSRPLSRLLLDLPVPPADLIAAVPVGTRALRERGFNQTLLLARALSRGTGVPLGWGAVIKTRETRPQVGLSSRERASNLRGAFAARGRLDGLRVALVDDVVTTGATARECSKALLGAGAREVTVVALARASRGWADRAASGRELTGTACDTP
ncbi:MAG: ComF family protein [Thermodesulfovibrionales bacterium]